MLIAYLTTDDVNLDLALGMAEEAGSLLYPLLLREAPPDGQFDAVVYDWDYLPAQYKQDVLSQLLFNRLPCPVALHSYNLDENQVKALRMNGVAVYRRLESAVFANLQGGR